MQSDSELYGRVVIDPHCTVSLVHSLINYTAVASVVDDAERADSQEPAGVQDITIKTVPDTIIKTAPAFKSIIFESVEKLLPCWGGIATFIATTATTAAIRAANMVATANRASLCYATTAATTVANMVATASRASRRPRRCAD